MTDSKSTTVHEIITREEEIKGSSDRSFGVVFTIFFSIIGCWPLMNGQIPHVWALIVAGSLLIIAIIYPRLLAPLNHLWLKFGLLLHKITNPLILGLVFFVTVTPIAIIMRILGKDPLNRRIDCDAKSYWIDRHPPGPAPDTMPNQF